MKKIVIYSTEGCIYCKMAKEFFKANKIKYTEIDVSNDPEKAQEMIDKSGQMGVPVIIISDGKKEEQIIIGFNQTELKKALEI